MTRSPIELFWTAKKDQHICDILLLQFLSVFLLVSLDNKDDLADNGFDDWREAELGSSKQES